MASKAQRRARYDRRRAHALRRDRRGVLHGQVGYLNAKFDRSLILPSVNHLAEDFIFFADKYLELEVQPWQKRVIRNFVGSS